MKSILIIGAGGHGQVVAECAEACGYEKIDFLDDNYADAVGGIDELEDIAINYDGVIVSIGNNEIRRELISRVQIIKAPLTTLIHPGAYVSPTATVGSGSIVLPGVVIHTNAIIGKGCIICFSSGNKAVYSIEQSVAAEAALDEVLAVGAIYANGMRHGESCYGLELDLVAPGYAIPTLDREGNYGETNGDYFLDFQKTSAACPHVSGVAALMLSARPELTREQVHEILERTAQKVGNYDYNDDYNNYHPNGTWHQEVGHGLVDAHMAVVEASLYGREVSLLGEEQLDLCDETTYTCSIYHPDNFYFEWSFSENLAIVSHINSTARVMPIATGDAFIQVDVYSEGRLVRSLRKNIRIIEENHLSLTPLGTRPFSVTNNTTWGNSNHSLPFNATVESGATLTITGTVYCSNHANIIVKPGGRLVLDGGTLTSFCPNSMWPGIEVWGNSAAHQYPDASGHYAQGYVELKNGAVIENAECPVLPNLQFGSREASICNAG